MTGDDATALYLAEKAKRAERDAAKLAEATARLEQLDAERKERQLGNHQRGRRPLVAPLTKRDRDVIREAQLDTITWEKFAR